MRNILRVLRGDLRRMTASAVPVTAMMEAAAPSVRSSHDREPFPMNSPKHTAAALSGSSSGGKTVSR